MWADLNPSSYHTKDMGTGNRADTIEDKIDSHNYLKNLGCGELFHRFGGILLNYGSVDILRRKLVVALAEREEQIGAFKEINKTVSPEVREDWQKMIDAWLEEGTGSNPYVLSTQGESTYRAIPLLLTL
jgi:hypothetical protein